MKPTARTSRASSGQRVAARATLRPRNTHVRLLLLSLLLLFTTCLLWRPAQAQSPAGGAYVDPPGRVARLNLAEGPLSFAPAGSDQWSAAPYNRPLTNGDRLWTAPSSRAEIDTGDALLRLDGATSVLLQQVDDEQVKLQLLQGTLALRLAELAPGDRYEIDTPNLAFVADRSGDYRIDVDPGRGVTQVTVLSGDAVLYGDRGEATELRAGQRLAFRGRQLAAVGGVTAGGASDAFDQWVATRDRALDQSTAARHVSPGTVGYQQLDQYGSWTTSSEYGSVWYPSDVPTNWAPYRYGQWTHIEPWGWTWVDDAPWGFAPFHYGRWVQSGTRWGWVPGPQVRRATYAPALVAFGGGSGGDVHWRPGRSSQWFPLAPGEAWRPGFSASDRYIDRVNRGIRDGGGRHGAPDRYVYAGRPGAITSVDRTDWEPRRPVRGVPVGNGYDAAQRAPFALPTMPLPKPQVIEQAAFPRPSRDPLRGQEQASTHDWSVRRGPSGDVLVPPAAGAGLPQRSAQPGFDRPQVFEAGQQPQIDWQRQQQIQQQQVQRAQYQQRQQERQNVDQQRYQYEQQQRVQAEQQQQRYQLEQQQRVQAEQQRRQADQWQRQQQMQQQQQQQQQQQNSMRERQLQQQVRRDYELYQRQQQQSDFNRAQQNRGVPP